MTSPIIALLPQLAGGAAHTHALGFAFDGLDGDRVRVRVPWREDLVGDPDSGVLAGGLVTTLLARRVDDLAYGAGLWAGAVRHREWRGLAVRVVRARR